MAKKTVVVSIPTCYEDAQEALESVRPYLQDMCVVYGVLDIRDELPGDDVG
jgi:hypothetical protein